jgi:steroid 5-alpha reductase family enzyme
VGGGEVGPPDHEQKEELNMQWSVLLASAGAICVLMVSMWVLSVKVRDASIVDIIWGFGFVMVAWVARAVADGNRSRQNLLVFCATLWGLRLAGYLFWRNHGKGEDYRYRAMRKKFGARFPIVSLYSVFGLQGLLMFVVSLPLQLGQMPKRPLGATAFVGVALWVVGLLFETVGDAQLARFKSDPSSAGQVMDKGLWAWTRHPNYFGDCCVWVGLTLIAVDAGGVAWAGIVGGIAMTILLVRVSGVPMLEKTIGRRRPGYAEYVARTSGFIPRPPRRS